MMFKIGIDCNKLGQSTMIRSTGIYSTGTIFHKIIPVPSRYYFP